MGYVILSIVIVAIVFALFSDVFRLRKFEKMTVVNPGVEYPNNYHVMGVGYYHAASESWYPQPWNEYREGRGYYWNGTWNTAPDQRLVPKSTPSPAEVDRVNRQWRKADPDATRRFWDSVEREGFGTAIRRSEGS